jgi:hypothetical protein
MSWLIQTVAQQGPNQAKKGVSLPFRSIPARPFAASRLPISSLLATTSVAALLFALPTGALGGPGAGQSVNNQTVATVTNAAGQSITSIVITNSTVTGAVTNAGTITPGKLTLGPSPAAIFLDASTVNGGVLNSGTINAVVNQNNARAFGIGASSVAGGITNTGTIFGSTDAIILLGANGVTVTQAAGALIGGVRNIAIVGPASIRGAAIAIASNVLNVTGGALSLQPTSTVSGFGIVNQSGGNILLQPTSSNSPGSFPTVTAGNAAKRRSG